MGNSQPYSFRSICGIAFTAAVLFMTGCSIPYPEPEHIEVTVRNEYRQPVHEVVVHLMVDGDGVSNPTPRFTDKNGRLNFTLTPALRNGSAQLIIYHENGQTILESYSIILSGNQDIPLTLLSRDADNAQVRNGRTPIGGDGSRLSDGNGGVGGGSINGEVGRSSSPQVAPITLSSAVSTPAPMIPESTPTSVPLRTPCRLQADWQNFTATAGVAVHLINDRQFHHLVTYENEQQQMLHDLPCPAANTFVFEVSAKMIAGTPPQQAGTFGMSLIFGKRDNGREMYILHLGENQQWVIYRWRDEQLVEVWTPRRADPAILFARDVMTLRLEVEGNRGQFTIDNGTPYMFTLDEPLQAGTFALATNGPRGGSAEFAFADLLIRSP